MKKKKKEKGKERREHASDTYNNGQPFKKIRWEASRSFVKSL